MEGLVLHEGYPYELDVLLDPRFPSVCIRNFRGHLLFHDTATNLFIFQAEPKPGAMREEAKPNAKPSVQEAKSPGQEATSSGKDAAKLFIPSLSLFRGDCITNVKPCSVKNLKEGKKEIQKEWENRKFKKEGEQCVVGDPIDGQKVFSILSERYGEDTKWEGSDIVVKNQIRVSRPYLIENAVQECPNLLEEIKQMLKPAKNP